MIEHLKSAGVTKFGLWGSGMGATAAMMYMRDNNADVKFAIFDGDFASMEDIINKSLVKTPRPNEDQMINNCLAILNPKEAAKDCKVPALFL